MVQDCVFSYAHAINSYHLKGNFLQYFEDWHCSKETDFKVKRRKSTVCDILSYLFSWVIMATNQRLPKYVVDISKTGKSLKIPLLTLDLMIPVSISSWLAWILSTSSCCLECEKVFLLELRLIFLFLATWQTFSELHLLPPCVHFQIP